MSTCWAMGLMRAWRLAIAMARGMAARILAVASGGSPWRMPSRLCATISCTTITTISILKLTHNPHLASTTIDTLIQVESSERRTIAAVNLPQTLSLTCLLLAVRACGIFQSAVVLRIVCRPWFADMCDHWTGGYAHLEKGGGSVGLHGEEGLLLLEEVHGVQHLLGSLCRRHAAKPLPRQDRRAPASCTAQSSLTGNSSSFLEAGASQHLDRYRWETPQFFCPLYLCACEVSRIKQGV